MLRSLKIENFRCFPTFEMQQLGKINLLVGTNNSGKTSILEAIHMLSSPRSLEPLREVMNIRGEYVLRPEQTGEGELDIRHLFYGHEINQDSRFSISGDNYKNREGITVSIIKHIRQLSSFEGEGLEELVLNIEWLGQEQKDLEFPLSSKEGLKLDYYARRIRSEKDPVTITQFVTSSSLTISKMIELFDDVVLSPEEDLIIEALQTIEPSIKRIASVNQDSYNRYDRYNNSRGSFVVQLANSDQRIPIGSMGDGIWRILGLTLAIVSARNGVLLVDEIDTGLHFSAMNDMWKLIWKTAKKLNVQVFATTHNSDCWTSLAAIASTEHPSEEGITIHRIEKGKTNSVVFTERQIVIAAERGIEVR